MYKDIKVVCWLKNNAEWYYPTSSAKLDLSKFKHVEPLSENSMFGDFYFAWDNDKKYGTLFRTLMCEPR